LLAVAHFKQSKNKPEDYIKGYDEDKFQEAANKIIYFNDENEFNAGLETMLTQSYKKIIKQQNN
jgi:hypothetical protein